MAKVKKAEVHLVSSAGTGHFYTYRRNEKKKGGDKKKLEMMKYDPIARKKVSYKEGKLSKLKKKAAPAAAGAKEAAEKQAK
jgi:large subunit ribosomal protein L33